MIHGSATGGGDGSKCLRDRMFYGADVAGIVWTPYATADRAGLPIAPYSALQQVYR